MHSNPFGLIPILQMIMPPDNTVHPWLAHLQGLTAIIKARSKKTGLNFPGMGFFMALEDSPNTSTWAINHDTPVDGWFLNRSDYDERILYSDFMTQDPLKPSDIAKGQSISSSLDSLILRAQPILKAAPSVFKNSHPDARANIHRLFSAARLQLPIFRAWPSIVPDDWQPKPIHHQIDAFELSQLDIFPGRVDIYSNC